MQLQTISVREGLKNFRQRLQKVYNQASENEESGGKKG